MGFYSKDFWEILLLSLKSVFGYYKTKKSVDSMKIIYKN